MRTTRSYAETETIGLLRALAEAYLEVSRRDERHSAQWGLAASEFDVVATLGNTEGMRMCDLASLTLNTKSNITRVVKDLAARGLVIRERNPICEREVFVRLTDEGERIFVEVYPHKYEFLRSMFDERLELEEQRRLIKLLQQLVGRDPGT